MTFRHFPDTDSWARGQDRNTGPGFANLPSVLAGDGARLWEEGLQLPPQAVAVLGSISP